MLEVTDINFEEEILDTPKPVILDFYATWCGPCKVQAPILQEILDTEDDYKVAKIDVDRNPELADKYGIMSIPTVLLMYKGKVIKEFIGITTKDEIIEAAKNANIV